MISLTFVADRAAALADLGGPSAVDGVWNFEQLYVEDNAIAFAQVAFQTEYQYCGYMCEDSEGNTRLRRRRLGVSISNPRLISATFEGYELCEILDQCERDLAGTNFRDCVGFRVGSIGGLTVADRLTGPEACCEADFFFERKLAVELSVIEQQDREKALEIARKMREYYELIKFYCTVWNAAVAQWHRAKGTISDYLVEKIRHMEIEQEGDAQ